MSGLPKHVAIIMDGNGRWAKRRGLPRIMGHKAGVNVVRKIVESCAQKKIEALTLFTFGLENQKRPETEKSFLMSLFSGSLAKYIRELHENGVRFRVIGDRSLMKPAMLKKVEAAEALTEKNTGLHLFLAFYYSGRWDIVNATKKITQLIETKKIKSDTIDEDLFQKHLMLNDVPELDLMIRTSGEQRISNFLLWQLAYAELYFTEVAWPDFSEAEFQKALDFYVSRERRFGMISEQL